MQNTVKDFEKFWSDYAGKFPGYARGGTIESLCKEIAFAAWMKAQDAKTQQNEIYTARHH